MSKFTFEDLGIPGPKLVRPRCFGDARGYFKIARELGWRPQESFESGLEKTVRWYLDNPDWWGRIRSGLYRGERLGLA